MKISKNIYKLILPLFLIVFVSCDKFLDVVPKGVVIPKTLDDYQALLSAPLEITRTSNTYLFMTDEIVMPESYRSAANSYPGKSAVKAYDFENELFDVNEDDPDWTIGYRTIYICNTVLSNIDNNNEADLIKKNQIKGEALVHRAYTYLTLVNEYAKHFNATSASTDLGVPMPLKPDINALLPRASVKVIYDQIEKDLLDAMNLLPDRSTYTYRPNKAAAFGTLARMYLFMGNWTKANEYAGKAYQLSNFIYDYNSFSWADPSNRAISALTGYPASSVNMKDIVLQKYLRLAGGYNFVFFFSSAQSGLFTNGDLREVFGSSPKDWYGTTLQFPGILDTKASYDYNHAGITTAELLLTRAEAQARLLNTQAAIDDLNTLRKKRFKTATYTDLTAATPEQALQLVLNERRIELAFNGLRLFDIKRLNMLGANISITHGTKVLPAGDPRFVLPIPAKVISLNANIVPNPR